MLGVGAATAAIGYWISGRIARPVVRAAEVLDAVANGDLAQRLEIRSKDELGAWRPRWGALRTSCVPSSVRPAASLMPLAKATSRRADVSDLRGGYRQLCDGMNGMLDAVLEPIHETAAVMQRLASGDLTVQVDGDYPGDHAILKDSVNTTSNVLRQLVEALNGQIEAAEAGNLAQRADSSRFRGSYGQLVGQVNRLLDAVVAPIDEARSVLAAVAAGDLSRQVDGRYRGDFERIKTTINTTIGAFGLCWPSCRSWSNLASPGSSARVFRPSSSRAVTLTSAVK